jgi:hypothetical protein
MLAPVNGTGRPSAMQVPMPFVPSTSSTTPRRAGSNTTGLPAHLHHDATATPELSQSKTAYPASRTTLYNSSSSSWALR